MSLVRAGFVPLPPGARPGFDHADVYQAGRRMYVAHTGADRVDVLDCERQVFVCSLPDLPGVAGVLIDEAHDLLFTSDREAARVSVFRCSPTNSYSAASASANTRTDSPTTGAAVSSTRSTWVSRWARTARPR